MLALQCAFGDPVKVAASYAVPYAAAVLSATSSGGSSPKPGLSKVQVRGLRLATGLFFVAIAAIGGNIANELVGSSGTLRSITGWTLTGITLHLLRYVHGAVKDSPFHKNGLATRDTQHGKSLWRDQ
ncbi:hypothetical protein GOEFS_050_00620 [Gordonia effusa NBRC 100432]|uniref:Uncharacterized protein n=1 Tax=Gordonia effusa NBRC 100432 TaxID=1077974 RepID=H0QZN3_9ACTN|nr:hypothetical protein GOEFS_050_00620 [Gordonia effusa NBRC 100432]